MPSQKKAYSYIRFSTKHQEQGDSLARQTEDTEIYCKRNDLLLDNSLDLKDLGVSAYKGKNQREKSSLGRFIQACKNGIVERGSALIVEAIDRLTRETPRKAISLITTLLDDYGIEIHLTMYGKVLRPEEDRGDDMVFISGLVARANEESKTKSDRLKHAFKKKRERAINKECLIAKSVPWWLTITKEGKITCPKERAAIVKKIFQLTAKGNSSNKIARLLDEKKVPTWRPQQFKWSSARVRDLVRSDSPLGILRETYKTNQAGRTHELPGYYPKIISEELAIQARAVLKRNNRGNRGRVSQNPARPINLLRGLARYKNHWVSLTTIQNGTIDPKTNQKGFNAYYLCYDELAGKTLFNMASHQIEGVLMQGLSELTIADLVPLPSAKVLLKSKTIQKKLDDIESRLLNLLAAVEYGSTTIAKRITALETEKEKLQVEIAQARAEEAIPTVSPQTLAQIQNITLDLLKDPEARERIATHLRQIVTRIDIGRGITDLDIPAPLLYQLADKLSKFEIEIQEDKTSTIRPRKRLALLVTFAGGAKRLITRGLPNPDQSIQDERDNFVPEGIMSYRIEPNAEEPTDDEIEKQSVEIDKVYKRLTKKKKQKQNKIAG
jgi:DNA invertase Pin-like site-specific DNA recombinase